MPPKFPCRYEATGELIAPGQHVAIEVDGKQIKGIVRHVSTRSRRVEVVVAKSVLPPNRLRRFISFRRRDVTPLPWLPPVTLVPPMKRG